MLVKSHLCGPKLEARTDFESSRRADSESGLGSLPSETRHFRFFAPPPGMHYAPWLCIDRAFVPAGLTGSWGLPPPPPLKPNDTRRVWQHPARGCTRWVWRCACVGLDQQRSEGGVLGWGGGKKSKISRSARERKEPGFGVYTARAFERWSRL
jgi:hypothetical protein